VTTNSSPPDLTGLTWRTISLDDLQTVVELARTCLLSDGGLSFLFEPDVLKDRYFPDAPGTGIGAFDLDGRLVACSTVYISGEAGAQRTRIVGQVRPDQRDKGIGAYLMDWSQNQALDLRTGTVDKPLVLQIATESLTESAHRLYRAQGFENIFEELVMRRDLSVPLANYTIPPGVTLMSWQSELAEEFYQAYYPAFRERPGFPGWSAAEWIAQVIDNDLIPEWTLLARADGVPSGFLIGCIDLTTTPPGGYVQQIGVIPAQRRRGLASALLVETMRRMQAAGADAAQLTVHINNPGAIEAYARLGFVTIGRRARYERIID
jgi:ribosomal protein S18 acetylase RimI-like enzyme